MQMKLQVVKNICCFRARLFYFFDSEMFYYFFTSSSLARSLTHSFSSREECLRSCFKGTKIVTKPSGTERKIPPATKDEKR